MYPRVSNLISGVGLHRNTMDALTYDHSAPQIFILAADRRLIYSLKSSTVKPKYVLVPAPALEPLRVLTASPSPPHLL